MELVDLFPTLVDLAGLPALPECPSDSHNITVCTEGASLSHVVNGHHHRRGRHAGNLNAHRGDGGEGLDSRNVESNAVLSHPTDSGHRTGFSLSGESILNAKNSSISNKIAQIAYESRPKKAETHTQEYTQKEFTRESPKPITSLLVEKKAAFSQYPRPGPTPSRDPDSDQPRTRDTTIMGYSVRTNRFRYTAWLKFDNVTYCPDWDHIVAEELYDHETDPSEDHNVVGKRSYAQKKKRLYAVLHGGWKSALRWR